MLASVLAGMALLVFFVTDRNAPLVLPPQR